jgi:hypothetical protein
MSWSHLTQIQVLLKQKSSLLSNLSWYVSSTMHTPFSHPLNTSILLLGALPATGFLTTNIV